MPTKKTLSPTEQARARHVRLAWPLHPVPRNRAEWGQLGVTLILTLSLLSGYYVSGWSLPYGRRGPRLGQRTSFKALIHYLGDWRGVSWDYVGAWILLLVIVSLLLVVLAIFVAEAWQAVARSRQRQT